MMIKASVVAYSIGLVFMSVCALASVTEAEVVSIANSKHPTGLDHPWTKSEESFAAGQSNPCPCDTEPETRQHYLLVC